MARKKSGRRSPSKAKSSAKAKAKRTVKKAAEKAVGKTVRKAERRTGMALPLFIMICLFAAAFAYGAYLERGGEESEPEIAVQNFIDKDADLSVHFIDVGQGDCSLIVYKDKAVLIDAGEREYGKDAAAYISALGIKKLDYVIATHPHSDHIGGLAEVIASFDVGTVIAPRVSEELTQTSASYERFLDALRDKALRMTAAKAGTVYSLADESIEGDNTSFEILAPLGDDYDNLNDWSVVIKLVHGETSFLFTGDAGKAAESDILDSGADISADVLKTGHHGSSSSSSDAFIKAVSPSAAVIQCGDGNSYGHPHREVTDRFDKYGVKYYRTDAFGTVVIYSDGEKIRITTERKNK